MLFFNFFISQVVVIADYFVLLLRSTDNHLTSVLLLNGERLVFCN